MDWLFEILCRMRKSNLVLFLTCFLFITGCTPKKEMPQDKEIESPKYIALKNRLEKDIVGLWKLYSVTFRESGTIHHSKRKILSKIKLNDTVLIEFKSNHHVEINSENIGKWKFEGLNMRLKGKDIQLPVPFFCNSSYRIGVQKTYSKLTANVNVGGNLYEVQYVLVKI